MSGEGNLSLAANSDSLGLALSLLFINLVLAKHLLIITYGGSHEKSIPNTHS